MLRKFEVSLEIGRATERLMARWLMTRGHLILPVYDYTGSFGDKAPKLAGLDRSYVLPDLLAARDGKPRFVEMKWKETASFTNMTQRYETGVNLRHFEDYVEVQRITGIPCFLVFAHESQDEVLGRDIDHLARHLRRSAIRGCRMAYFPCAVFWKLETLTGLRQHAGVAA